MKKMALLAALLMVPALALADGLDKNIEMLRSDLRTTKVSLLTESLGMTEAQSSKFWPIQREYETALASLQDQRIALIKDYANNFDSLTDAKATELMNKAIKLDEQRNALIKKYAARASKEVSPKIGARYYQVEKFVQSLIDVQIRGEVPLVP